MIWKPWTAGLLLSVVCLLPVGGMISAAPVASPGVLGPVAVVTSIRYRRSRSQHEALTIPKAHPTTGRRCGVWQSTTRELENVEAPLITFPRLQQTARTGDSQ